MTAILHDWVIVMPHCVICECGIVSCGGCGIVSCGWLWHCYVWWLWCYTTGDMWITLITYVLPMFHCEDGCVHVVDRTVVDVLGGGVK